MKKEIERIIISLNKKRINLILGEKHDELIQKIRNNFIQGNPRALWEGFKYKPISIDTEGEYPYLKIPDLVSEKEYLYLIIDDNNKEYHILKGQIESLILFIEDCEGLGEYYIVSSNLERIICENDHDALLHIDLSDI